MCRTGPGSILSDFGISADQSGFDIGLSFAGGFVAAFPAFKAAVDAYVTYLRASVFLVGESPAALQGSLLEQEAELERAIRRRSAAARCATTAARD